MKQFGDRLREARIAAGMTQEQLGLELGVTKSSVSAWENGRETPGFRLLDPMRRALGRSLDELICGSSLSSPEVDSTRHGSGTDTTFAVRTSEENRLLARYRQLAARKRGALLELIRPD